MAGLGIGQQIGQVYALGGGGQHVNLAAPGAGTTPAMVSQQAAAAAAAAAPPIGVHLPATNHPMLPPNGAAGGAIGISAAHGPSAPPAPGADGEETVVDAEFEEVDDTAEGDKK